MRTQPLAFALVGALFAVSPARAENTCGQDALPPEPEAPSCGDTLAGDRFDGTEAPYSCGEARVFFVDFPLWLRAPDATASAPAPAVFYWQPQLIGLGGSSLALESRFEDRLADAIGQRLEPRWLCPEGPCGEACRDAAEHAVVDVRPLLAERAVAGRRADGHRRFWRIRVRTGGEALDPWFTVQAFAQGDMVQAVREAAQAVAPDFGLTGAEAQGIKVGRQACAVTPASDPDWHLRQIQAVGLPAVPLAEADRPVVALLDTEIPNVHGVDHLRPDPEPTVPDAHAHGEAMADLVRQIAPGGTADLWGHRVIDGAGVGTIGAVARGLDAALFDETRPVIANLSLSWLPEFERRRVVRAAFNGQPAIVEDGVGAAVRYLLAVAGEIDTPQRPVLVVAAAGNRPLDNEQVAAFDALNSYDGCTDPWFANGRSPQLMPAEWSRTTETCQGAATPVLAVGAVDDRGLRSVLSIPDPQTEPRLVAPGQHVLDSQGRPWTGTSVAAALTSGAAARLLALLQTAGQPLPSGAALGDLLYALGRDLGRDTLGGVPVRHLSLEALQPFAFDPNTPAVIDCVNDGVPASDCLDREILPLEPAIRWPTPRPEGCDPELTGAPAHSPCASDTAWWAANCVDTLTFSAAPHQRRAAMGRVGPQPSVPMPCGDCLVYQRLNKMDEVVLDLRFSSEFPAGTRFTELNLLVYANGQKWYVPLKTEATAIDPATGKAQFGFAPGQQVTLKGVSLPSKGTQIDQVALVSTTTQWGKYPALQVSPLHHKLLY